MAERESAATDARPMTRHRPVTVVCARADHPEGYGFGGKAHGYVTLLVTGIRVEELPMLRERLNRPVMEPFMQGGSTSWWGTWYGGRFDPVAVIKGAPNGEHPMAPGLRLDGGKVCSVGDNRAVLSITYAEIMQSDAQPKASNPQSDEQAKRETMP